MTKIKLYGGARTKTLEEENRVNKRAKTNYT